MRTYLYPKNLKSKATLWLWTLRDFASLCVAALFSVLLLVQLRLVLPLALTLCFGFLSIRAEDRTVLDYLSDAIRFFFTEQQFYEWR